MVLVQHMLRNICLMVLHKKCREIKSIKFSKNIDTSNITNMSYMFNYCYALNTLDISNFITINVISMESMFQYCPFTDLDLTNFNTHNVKYEVYVFSLCQFRKNIRNRK